MTDVIDLAERRNAADRPDADCTLKDDFGRDMFVFALSYKLGSSTYGIQLVAYDVDDAAAKVAAMRESLELQGQIYSMIPAEPPPP